MHVHRALGHGENVDAGVIEQLFSQCIIENRSVLAVQSVLGRVGEFTLYVGRESHLGELTVQHLLDVGQHRGVAARHPVLAYGHSARAGSITRAASLDRVG